MFTVPASPWCSAAAITLLLRCAESASGTHALCADLPHCHSCPKILTAGSAALNRHCAIAATVWRRPRKNNAKCLLQLPCGNCCNRSILLDLPIGFGDTLSERRRRPACPFRHASCSCNTSRDARKPSPNPEKEEWTCSPGL